VEDCGATQYRHKVVMLGKVRRVFEHRSRHHVLGENVLISTSLLPAPRLAVVARDLVQQLIHIARPATAPIGQARCYFTIWQPLWISQKLHSA
jgi:hypothetical protein